jgi:hypothetical protein
VRQPVAGNSGDVLTCNYGNELPLTCHFQSPPCQYTGTTLERWRVDGAKYVDPSGARVSFATWAEKWQETLVSCAHRVPTGDRRYLRNHVLPTFGRYELVRIDPLMVATWVADLAQRRAPATVHKAHHIMAKIMRSAVDAGLIAMQGPTTPQLPGDEWTMWQVCPSYGADQPQDELECSPQPRARRHAGEVRLRGERLAQYVLVRRHRSTNVERLYVGALG